MKKEKICVRCGKALPGKYNKKYCEGCIGRKADNVKKVGKGALKVAGLLIAAVPTVVSATAKIKEWMDNK